MRHWIGAGITLSLILITGAGCRVSAQVARAPGDYEGYATLKKEGKSTQHFVQGKLSRTSNTGMSLSVKAEDGSISWNFDVTAYSVNHLRMSAPSLIAESIDFQPSGLGCYKSWNGSAADFKVCFDGRELTVDEVQGDTELILVMDKRTPGSSIPLEAPKSYTVRELLNRAKSQSFNSQLQFQAAVLSRLNSQTAHLNLLPHFSFGDILKIVNFNWTGITSLIGNLAPFLMPQNWFAARAASYQSAADAQALVAMKADSANIAEGLGYQILRDRESLERLSDYEAPIAELRDLILEKERLKLVPKGTSTGIIAVLNSLTITETQLRQTIIEGHRSLAQAVGMVNPEAISTLSVGADVPDIEKPLRIDIKGATRTALDFAPERKQMGALIGAANATAHGRDFFWLDPSGGGSGIGFGTPSYLRAGAIPARELAIQQKQLESTIISKVENSFTEIDTSTQTFIVSRNNAALLAEHMDQLREAQRLHMTVSTAELQQTLQGLLQSEVDMINARYSYIVSVGKLHRLMFDGDYADIIRRTP